MRWKWPWDVSWARVSAVSTSPITGVRRSSADVYSGPLESKQQGIRRVNPGSVTKGKVVDQHRILGDQIRHRVKTPNRTSDYGCWDSVVA